MIQLLVDEAYAFDYLTILKVKQIFAVSDGTAYEDCLRHLKVQIPTLNEVLLSEEYYELLSANMETFQLVEKAKRDEIPASEVDKANYRRYLAKLKLQGKFFNGKLVEDKTERPYAV